MTRNRKHDSRNTLLLQDYANTLTETAPGTLRYLPHMDDDLYEFRFEQRHGDYMIRCWHNGIERMYRESVDNMPEWLSAILATAKVAGAIRPIKTPPPEIVLWFRTDEHHNLVEFIEMK